MPEFVLKTFVFTTFASIVSVASANVLPAQENAPPPESHYSPYVDDHFPNQVYFGDTHLHTSWSTDAGMVGGTAGQ